MAYRKRNRTFQADDETEHENAEFQDTLRESRALSLRNEDQPITGVAHQRVGTHGLYEKQFDEEVSVFNLAAARREGFENLELCKLLDGKVWPDFEEAHYHAYSIAELCGALRLAWRELNDNVVDGLVQMIEDAADLHVTVPERSELDQLRTDEFHEDNEEQFRTRLYDISKRDVLELMKNMRCELAWTKDNRDWLIQYVDMAQDLKDNGTPHKLKFEFYARNMDIELMANEEREKMRIGNGDEGSTEHATPGPIKKRRQRGRPGESNTDDTPEDNEGFTPEFDRTADDWFDPDDMDIC